MSTALSSCFSGRRRRPNRADFAFAVTKQSCGQSLPLRSLRERSRSAMLPTVRLLLGLSLAVLTLVGPSRADEGLRLAPLASVAIQPQRSAPAQVIARFEAKIAAEVAARIAHLAFDVGETVREGSVLVRLDDGDARLALARAEAQLAAAQARAAQTAAQTGRARELAQRAFISADALQAREAELAVAEAEVRLAEAGLATARRALDKHVVRAPFDGIVRARSGQLGELASPGTPLYLLTASDGREVAAQVTATDAVSLRNARDIEFETAGERRSVRLQRLSALIEREARTLEARLRFVGAPAAIGSEGRLLWRDVRPHLPPELLVRRDGRVGVIVAESGKARFVALPEAQEGRPAATSLPAASEIVVSGQQALADGVPLPAGKR